MIYKCAWCLDIFESSWSDEEALAEAQENFGKSLDYTHCEVVCDDCYNRMNELMPLKTREQGALQ